MRARKNSVRLLWCLYAIFWTGAVYTRCVPSANPAPGWASPLFLVLSAAIVLLNEQDWRAAACFGCGGFAAEIVGVGTGVPFGHYTYSGALGPSAAKVPLAIACAWLILLSWSRALASKATGSRIGQVAIGAGLTTSADLLIDPVATRSLHFWQWDYLGPWFGVPIVNFVGWFVVSGVLLTAAGPTTSVNRSAIDMGVATLAFFGVIAVCA